MAATVNYTLQKISENLFIKHGSKERDYIGERLTSFQTSIKKHFGNNVNKVVIFGSYDRDTILPRRFDKQSDIDVLIEFNQAENERTPETYRNQLRQFAKERYFANKVVKDHPSVVLNMKGIKFDLVPCRIVEQRRLFRRWNEFQIPGKDSEWMATDPDGFTNSLTEANKRYNNIVKPIIRLLKRWNASNGHPYESFMLERIIAGMDFSGDTLQSGFTYAIKNLPDDGLSQVNVNKVNSAKTHAELLKRHLSNEDQTQAMLVVRRILKIRHRYGS